MLGSLKICNIPYIDRATSVQPHWIHLPTTKVAIVMIVATKIIMKTTAVIISCTGDSDGASSS